MEEKLYRIKPFKWVKCYFGEYYYVNVEFGTYRVYRRNKEWYWEYEFIEFYDEGTCICQSLEEGKKRAWEHWVKRLSKCLEEIKNYKGVKK